MSDIQAIINAMSNAARAERTRYHLTLGGYIEALERATPTAIVTFDTGGSPGLPRSYRGYYSDLSFPKDEALPVSEALRNAKRALLTTYEGYKGGDYKMEADTPLWTAPYGMTGDAIIGIDVRSDAVVLVTREVD